MQYDAGSRDDAASDAFIDAPHARRQCRLFAAAELATLPGIDQAADAFMIEGAGRLAIGFPLLDRSAPCLFVFLFLGETASAGTFVGGGVLLAAVCLNAIMGAREQLAEGLAKSP